MTNLNKEIASFIQLFTRKGLLKRKNNSSFSFLIKNEFISTILEIGAMGAIASKTTTTEFSVFPNILKKSPIAHVSDGRDGRDGRYGRFFQYPPIFLLH